jgi:triacylglycerol esterase/lipase EstA (alpha/beta hydrolase family)
MSNFGSPSMYSVLKAGYTNDDNIDTLKNFGYVKDIDLSNGNEQVYYNKDNKKMIYNVVGTHNLLDVGTDVYLAMGKLKQTNRFKDANNVLNQARDKYKPENTTLTGHSLGGSIVQYLGKKGDNVLSLDAGYTIGTKTRGNAYRTSGDVVSLLGSGATHMKTLKNNNLIQGGLFGTYYSHDIKNIKNSGIFV